MADNAESTTIQGTSVETTASPQAKRTRTDGDADAASAREAGAPSTNNVDNSTETTNDDAASKWTPPSFGHPCWIGVPVHNVARAQKFFEDVFEWKFNTAQDTKEYKPEDTMMIQFEGSKIGGGLIRCDGPQADDASFKPSGGTTIYLWVEDIDEVLEKVKTNGGEVVVTRKAEGKMGWQGKFRDPEGNIFGVYTARKPDDKEPEAAAAKAETDTPVKEAEGAPAAAAAAKDEDTEVTEAPAPEPEAAA